MSMTLFTPLYSIEGPKLCVSSIWSNLSPPQELRNNGNAFGVDATCKVQDECSIWSNSSPREELRNNGHAVGVDATCKVQDETQGWENVSAEEALAYLEHKPQPPSIESLAHTLQKCRERKNILYARHAHLYSCYNGLDDQRLLRILVYIIFVECGRISDAQQVFHRFAQENMLFLPSLVESYIEIGELEHALEVFCQMQFDCSQLSKKSLQALLKGCTKLKCAKQGQEVHAGLVREGLETDIVFGTSLIEMYAKCCLLAEAREVLDEMPIRDAFAWNVLSMGYTACGLDGDALQCLEWMQMEGVFPNSVTYVCGLKICGRTGSLEKGQELHTEIAKEGFELNNFVGSALLDMYAKCNHLVEAQEVFKGLLIRDVVSWTALIAQYADYGQGTAALDCFEQMQSEGVLPNAVTLMGVLKACASIGALRKGQDIHAKVVEEEFENDTVIGSALVDMYAKCGSLVEARAVFEELPVRDVILWTSLIAGYAEHGLDDEVLNSVERMQIDDVLLDPIVFVHTLKACSNIGTIDRGLKVHVEIVKEGFECNAVVSSALMDMYAKFGLLGEAQDVFDELLFRDVILWTVRMTGLVEDGLGREALMCLDEMQIEGVCPNDITYVCSLLACRVLESMDTGRQVHARIVSVGYDKDPVVGNALLDFYVKRGSLAEAWKIFDHLVAQDVVSWNTIIAGFTEHELGQEVLNSVEKMQVQGFSPNDITLLSCLKACSFLGAVEEGKRTHAEIVKAGYDRDLTVGNTLVDMYTKLGLPVDAYEVFDKMQARDVISWNILISGFIEHQLWEQSLDCLEQMITDDVLPNVSTLVCGLKCYCSIAALGDARELHAEITRKGYDMDWSVGTALVNMYGSFGLLTDARKVFDNLSVKDVAWNALISGYVEFGFDEEVLACYEEMLAERSPDGVTFVGVLKACGNVGAIVRGQEVHILSIKEGFEDDSLVGNTLVDMYAKCGCCEEACQLFERLIERDLVSWSAIIAGYARLGECEAVFYFFDDMKAAGVLPDGVAILSVITACSHSGLVDKGEMYFEAMGEEYGISPMIEHHNCMIDLLSRAGQLDMAMLMVMKMPHKPNSATWSTMLGACRKWGNDVLGQYVFELALKSNEKQAAALYLMQNIYAASEIELCG